MSRDALIVGISTYQWLPGLSAPSHDAEAIAQRLQTDGDFRVVRMPEIIQAGQSRIGFKTHVTVAELEAALVKLFKPKGTNIPQTALFYFSGHGLQKDAGVQEGFLATSDANPSASFYGLSLFWLRRLLQESPVRQRIVLLDCCHSGELLNFLEADPGARSGTDRLFMAASREYEAAYESMIGQYSVFTQALLDGLDPSRTVNGTVTNYALTDWVSNALKREMQQPLFENSGSEILLTRGQAAPAIAKTELIQDVCPYRGLEFFDEAHAEYFFGREGLTDQLIEKLRVGNFAAVVGASGSGKSSLVRAGLIHTLRQGKKFSGSDRWRIQLISPTDQPLKSLATAFVNPKDSAVDRAEQLRRAETLLREGGMGLSHLVRASLMSAKHSRNSRLLLIIDQFEEVFTLCQGMQAERDRQSFFNSLMTALRELGDCFSVVVVLRADFFGKYSLYNGLAEQIEQHLVTVTPLTYEQIKASIVKPAEKAGIICEPNLIYNILLDVVGAPGELPLLQYTLLELWQQRQPDPNGGKARLTLDAYNELGGVRGTLQKRANDIFYSLAHEEQRVAKRIFIALTQIGDGTEDTRRRIAKSELVSPWFPVELVERVLEKLVIAKLVVTNRLISTCNRQDEPGQRLANISTALRFAQMRRGKYGKEGVMPNQASSMLVEGEVAFDIAGITRRSANELSDLAVTQACHSDYQETVEVAHEALIRNWTLLRTWLDENRELLQRQRRMEHAAKEWHALEETRSPEYLLHGDRLTEAEDYLIAYPDELSALAQRFIAVSREENRRTQKERRLLQLAVPCTLLVALVVTFSQYRAVVKSQAEKDYQLQISTSREQAAVAQSILQEPESDPTTALLISRLAAEKGGYTYEAQASLRAALQKLRLQSSLQGHQGAIHHVAFSPNQRYLATAGSDGTVLLWSLDAQAVEKVLPWNNDGYQPSAAGRPATQVSQSSTSIVAIAFSPDGKYLAAIAQNATNVQIWSVDSGKRALTLTGLKAPVQQLMFSPNGDWIAASAGNEVHVWNATNGQPRATLRHAASVKSLNFSPDNQQLVTVSGTGVQLWQVSNWQHHFLLSHTAHVSSAIFSPDSQLIATTSDDANTRLWYARSGQLRRVLRVAVSQVAQPLNQVLFSPDGRFLAAASAKQVQLWSVATGRPWNLFTVENERGNGMQTEQAMSPGDGFSRIAFSPDSRQLAMVGNGIGNDHSLNVVRLWNVQTGGLLSSLNGHSAAIASIQFSSDSTMLATASMDGAVRLWSAAMGSEFPVLTTGNSPIQWAAFRRVSSKMLAQSIASTTLARSSLLLQTAKGSPIEPFSGMVTVATDGTMQTWNPTQSTARLNDTRVASGSQEQRWKPTWLAGRRLGSFLSFLGGSINPTQSIQWLSTPPSLGGRKLLPFTTEASTPVPSPAASSALLVSQATSTATGSVPQDSESVQRPEPFRYKLPSDSKPISVAFSVDTQFMAIATSRGTVEIWQAQANQTLKRIGRLPTSTTVSASTTPAKPSDSSQLQSIRELAFSPDGKVLLGVGSEQKIYVWDVASRKLIWRLEGHEAAIEQAQFSADSQRIVSAGRDRTARIWQLATGQLSATFYQRDVVSSAHFSPDGQLLAIAGWDGTARILDATTGALRVVMAGHRGAVLDAEFSPDASTLVTASADGTVRLWDTKTGSEQALLRSAELGDTPEQIQKASFSPDGRYVASLNTRGQLQLWAATWDELLALARDRTIRQLKPEECLRYLRLSPNACPMLDDTGEQ